MRAGISKRIRGVAVAMACHAFKGALAILYAPLKLLPAKSGKVLFLSRQSDVPSIDFRLLAAELVRRDALVSTVFLCKRVREGVWESVRFFVCLVRSLYHLSTSQVCVLDSYWPAVSVLHHKESLKVVQMWHALGKIKRSGWQTVGRAGGRSETVSRIMKMHRGYDFVIAGSAVWNPFYRASFGVDEHIIRNAGLPRIDYLLNECTAVRSAVFERHPELKGAPVVLYAPTFRRGGGGSANCLIEALCCTSCHVVVKAHPNQGIDVSGFPVIRCPRVSTLDMLTVADYVITDYSAIALEAAVLNVKTLYYVPDYVRYGKDNGLNIDLFEAMPGCVFTDAADVVRALEREYPQASLDAYRKRYLPSDLGHSTASIADVIFGEAGLACAGS